MKKKMLYILILIIAILCYIGYKNYKKNELIKETNSILYFSDNNAKFMLIAMEDDDINYLELGNEILREIENRKKKVINVFLPRSR